MKDYLSNIFKLKGKVAVVIGGGGFLCGEMAVGLARAGVKIVIVDKSKDGMKKVSARIKRTGVECLTLCADVTNKGELEEALEIILKKFFRVDILINGAGINAPTPFFNISEEEWHAILDSHIKATFLGCQVFGGYMVKGAMI